MLVKEITLPWPDPALSSNAKNATPYRRALTFKAKKEARSHASTVAKERPRVPCVPNARILIEYYPPTRRGDVHNVPSSLKAYIDGIADAMGCDDRGFDVDYPREWAGSGKPGKVVFRIFDDGAGAAK